MRIAFYALAGSTWCNSLLAASGALPSDRNLVFTVSDAVSYDDNIFRLPPPDTPGVAFPGPGSSIADEMNSAALEANGAWKVGLQAINAKLFAADNLFAKNSGLDNVSSSAKLEWDWMLSDLATGQLGAEYAHYLANFANTEFYAKDMISDSDYYATGTWDLGPHWRITANTRGDVATHSATARDADDYESATGGAGVEYALSATNALGVTYQFTHLTFRRGERADGTLGNRDYKDNSVSAYLKYNPTRAIELDASGGFLSRSYDANALIPEIQSNNFSGDIWHIDGSWQPTVQSGLRVHLWRDLRAYVDAESNYFVSRGESIGPVWSPLERLIVSLDFSHERQDYIGQDLVTGSLPQRHDTLYSGKLKVEYHIRRRVEIDASYSDEKRSSDVASVIYDDHAASLSVRYSF